MNLEVFPTYHRTPFVKEINHKLAGAKVISQLDAKQGYLSVQTYDESPGLTSFGALDGRYRFKRLAYEFLKMCVQKRTDITLSTCEGTVNICDDIPVFGYGDERLNRNLHNLMQKARESGLICNVNKCNDNEANSKMKHPSDMPRQGSNSGGSDL